MHPTLSKVVDRLGSLCAEQHPGVEKMRRCWYPLGHETPHSWETLRPGETFKDREGRAFRATDPRGDRRENDEDERS